MRPRCLVEIVHPDDIRVQYLAERRLGGNAAKMQNAVTALDKAHDRIQIAKVALHKLFMGSGLAHIDNIGKAQQFGLSDQLFAHHAPQSTRSTGNQKSFHENLHSDGIGHNSTVRLAATGPRLR